jgi:hypothetical protein
MAMEKQTENAEGNLLHEQKAFLRRIFEIIHHFLRNRLKYKRSSVPA